MKAIPLNPQDPHDKIIWDGAKFREYTVKSGYSLLKQQIRVEVGEPSNPNSSKALWRAIWTANIPNKIKVFNWRVLHNILSTKVNLFERKISSKYSCELCEEEPEIDIHVLWICSEAQSVWTLENDTRHNMLVGTSIRNVEGFDFLGFKT